MRGGAEAGSVNRRGWIRRLLSYGRRCCTDGRCRHCHLPQSVYRLVEANAISRVRSTHQAPTLVATPTLSSRQTNHYYHGQKSHQTIFPPSLRLPGGNEGHRQLVVISQTSSYTDFAHKSHNSSVIVFLFFLGFFALFPLAEAD